MPRHSEKRILLYTPQQLFDLIADVGSYPEFLPWCKTARVLSRTKNELTADLVIGYGIFHEKFRSQVMLERPNRIEVRYVSGPMSHLRNEWQFKPKGKSACELGFEVDFNFRSSLLGAAMDLFFDKAITKMVASFESRAAQLYGKK